jgi:hypothetical protein
VRRKYIILHKHDVDGFVCKPIAYLLVLLNNLHVMDFEDMNDLGNHHAYNKRYRKSWK